MAQSQARMLERTGLMWSGLLLLLHHGLLLLLRGRSSVCRAVASGVEVDDEDAVRGQAPKRARHLLRRGVRVSLRSEDDADVRQVLRHECRVRGRARRVHVQGQAERAPRRQRQHERAVRRRPVIMAGDGLRQVLGTTTVRKSRRDFDH